MKYKNCDDTLITVTCPYYKKNSLKLDIPVKVGGMYCREMCKYFAGIDISKGVVKCLKEIADDNLDLILEEPAS